MKRALSLALALLCVLSCAPPVQAAAGGFENLRRVSVYADGLFSDVTAEDWYHDSVAAVYELGLMQGKGDGTFGVAENVLRSEAAALSARLHRLYRTGNMNFPAAAEGEAWYRPYVDYALENGLLDAEASDYEAPAARREFAVMLARALPTPALPAINAVTDGEIPDVTTATAGAQEIYRLYRAGVLTGNNACGTFTPEEPIERAAAAAIAARMAYRSLRQKFALQPRVWPDLEPMAAAEDEFFAGAAMLGNSLVDGMGMASGLPMAFYGATGATVFKNRLDEMLLKDYDKVYLEFGINEIGYTTRTVMNEYGGIIDRIRARFPDAEIYVMALTPVTAKRDAEGRFTMKEINAFNDSLRSLSAEKHCWYLDCCTTIQNESGFLPEEYAGWDGSPHLSNAGYRAWADVIRTYHA